MIPIATDTKGKDSQSRKYQLTLNNPADKGLDHDEIKRRLAQLKSAVYYCMADEIGLETQTPHTHVYVQLRSPARFSRIRRLLPDAHIEMAHGSAAENKAYIEKSGKWADDAKADTSVPGTFEEWGELPDDPGQGFRSDIAELYNMIVDGMSNSEIMAANPELAVHISRMDKIRQDILEDRYRSTLRRQEYHGNATDYIFPPPKPTPEWVQEAMSTNDYSGLPF